MIKAEIVCDSVAPSGVRLTTFVLTYPRFIHSEFMTHRVFSRNASSSRAIPVKKSIDMVINEPVIPLAFTKNQAGMQGGAALDGESHDKAVAIWLQARDAMANFAKQLADLEVHKQYANRLLEPFANITVVCTATDWNNFFTLRCHYMAQPEICALAELMYDAYSKSTPNKLELGRWHLPFINQEVEHDTHGDLGAAESRQELVEALTKRSVARCARVSYLNHEGKNPTFEEDMALYTRLVGAAPIHASPAEHQAEAMSEATFRSGNFRGWRQYRKLLPGENVREFTGSVKKPE